jgi:hypothetical protein
MECKNCKNKLKRAPSQAKRSKSGFVFCCRSCAAIFNNKNYPPKRHLTKICKTCLNAVRSDIKYCSICWVRYQKKNYLNDKTLDEATQKRKNDNNRYNQIRQKSRKIYLQSDRPKCCEVCKYDKHIEICHIKDIASFTKETLISEINDLDNLIALCRNHNWELDHGHITISNDF